MCDRIGSIWFCLIEFANLLVCNYVHASNRKEQNKLAVKENSILIILVIPHLRYPKIYYKTKIYNVGFYKLVKSYLTAV